MIHYLRHTAAYDISNLFVNPKHCQGFSIFIKTNLLELKNILVQILLIISWFFFPVTDIDMTVYEMP